MLKNICKIAFIKKSQVTSFLASSQSVKILPNSWTEIPITPSASNTCELVRRDTASGSEYSTNIQAVIKDEPPKEQLILRLDLDSGESLIIGDQDLPVKLQYTGLLLTKQLSTTHKSWRKPLILTT